MMAILGTSIFCNRIVKSLEDEKNDSKNLIKCKQWQKLKHTIGKITNLVFLRVWKTTSPFRNKHLIISKNNPVGSISVPQRTDRCMFPCEGVTSGCAGVEKVMGARDSQTL